MPSAADEDLVECTNAGGTGNGKQKREGSNKYHRWVYSAPYTYCASIVGHAQHDQRVAQQSSDWIYCMEHVLHRWHHCTPLPQQSQLHATYLYCRPVFACATQQLFVDPVRFTAQHVAVLYSERESKHDCAVQ